MNPQLRNEEDDLGAIDLSSFEQGENQSTDDDLSASAINLEEYANSPEAQEADWWDFTKDIVLQPLRGVAQAFTWPLDVLKIGMVGEALSDIDEVEAAFEKAGKPFDRDQYIKMVSDPSEYIPTQGLLEDLITDNTGFSFEPKTKTGKFLNKAVMVAKLAKGSVPIRLASGSVSGATKIGLEAAGVNPIASELLSDLAGGAPQGVARTARKFTPEVQNLMKIADKHGLPFYEFMTRPSGGAITPKISQAREAAIMKELGVTSEQAAKSIIEGKLPISQLRKQGFNLNQLEADAYSKVDQLASAHTKPIKTDQIVADIEKEVARIKKSSPSPSDSELTYINILEDEAKALTNPPKKQAQILGPSGQPLNPASNARVAKEISAEQLVKQHKNYNSNVKGIYRKPEFSGREESVRDAYAFLNNSVRNTMESQGSKQLADSFKDANKLFNQRAVLNRSEALIDKAFVNGEYSPKKLRQVLNSKGGQILKRDLGDQAIKEITEIADFGEKAVNHTSEILKKPKYAQEIVTWGNLAPFILGSTAKMKGALFLAKPIAERVKGYLLTRPATREVYAGIIRNAAKGSFNNMKTDFDKLNELVSLEFGSTDQFVKQMIEDLEVYEGDL
jgi:hypothetical protein